MKYYRARYYDASTGRFISEDPLGFNVDANFYAYVGNNPVLFRDPSGLCRIVVRFTKVWGLFNSHAYIVTTDASGTWDFVAAPEKTGTLLLRTDRTTNSSLITRQSLLPVRQYWTTTNLVRYNVALETALDQIEHDKIPYHFLSTNSNAVVTEILNAAHLPVPKPPVSTPGWGTPLGPFGGNSPIGPPLGGGGRGGIPK
jgi:hypothetical protein